MPDLKGYILYDSVYKPFQKWQNQRNRKLICGCQGPEIGKSCLQRVMEESGVGAG